MWSYDEEELEKICSKLDIEHQTTDKDVSGDWLVLSKLARHQTSDHDRWIKDFFACDESTEF